jgi:predicted dehydrogenase
MDDGRLPVAVVGAGDVGAETLDALVRLESVEIVGISDLDAAAAERAGKRLDVPVFTDNRALLVRARPRAAFLSVPTAAATELIVACADRGIHVWKPAPLAGKLDEAIALVNRMDKAGLKLAVGTHRRFAGGYREAHELTGAIGEVFLARAHYMFNWGARLGWRGDRASAGGGALLELGYHALDLLLWMLGMPEVVFSLDSCGYRPGERGPAGELLPVYDTDDTSAMLMRYGGGCMATVVASRRTGPVSEELGLHGRSGSLVASDQTCVLRDVDGNLLERSDAAASPIGARLQQLADFVDAVARGAKTYRCSGRENLLNMAMVEAGYLSGRTGQGESPTRLLATREIDEQFCLAYRPRDER